MVFDIARAMDLLGVGRIALEFGKDRGERFADKIGQHVEPPAMRHADDEFASAERAAPAQDRLQCRHQGFGALDAEPLGAGIAAVEKTLEGLGNGQDLQDLFAEGRRQRRSAVARLEFLLDPGALRRRLDMHIFDPDRAAIGRAQDRHDLAQARALTAEDVVEEDFAIEIGLCKAVAAVIKLATGSAPIEPERVEIGFEMTAHPIGTDQLQRPDRVARGQAQGFGIESGGVAVGARSVRLRPRRYAQFAERRRRIVADLCEKPPPAFVDRGGVVEKACVEIGDELGIGAGQKTRAVDISHKEASVRRSPAGPRHPRLLRRGSPVSRTRMPGSGPGKGGQVAQLPITAIAEARQPDGTCPAAAVRLASPQCTATTSSAITPSAHRAWLCRSRRARGQR